jgi:hypothetical protein
MLSPLSHNTHHLDNFNCINLKSVQDANHNDNNNLNSNTILSTLFEDDTEGGLHLPLGSSSPIMRKVHHLTARSLTNIRPPPFEINQDHSKKNATALTPRTATNNKHTSQELQAIQQWQKSCREIEVHSYEEVHQTVRAVLTQRRKQYATNTGNKSSGSCSRPPSTNKKEEGAIRHLDHIQDMLELATQHRTWFQQDGKLIVFQSVPHMSLHGVVTHPVLSSRMDEQDNSIATLSPGSVIHATEMIVLDSRTLRQVYPLLDSNGQDGTVIHSGRDSEEQQQHHESATIQLMKITSPYSGYIVSHMHDYPYIGPGSPLDYVPNYKAPKSDSSNAHSVESMSWIWRVVYQPDGAFVRNGAELISDQIATLPYGSFCNVHEKIINDMGLSRLKIQAVVRESCCAVESKEEERAEMNGDGGDWKEISGWTSLFINPLSGECEVMFVAFFEP